MGWTGWLIFIALIGIDQVTKLLIENAFVLGEELPVISGFFSLLYVHNTGAAWGFLSDKAWGIYILTAVSLAVTVFLLIRLPKIHDKLCFYSGLVFAAGTVGNLIDRLFRGYVVDFLSFTFGTYRYPTFNAADVFIVVGAIVFILRLLMKPKLVDELFGTDHKSGKHRHDTE
mgnify:CR=1 FL=1